MMHVRTLVLSLVFIFCATTGALASLESALEDLRAGKSEAALAEFKSLANKKDPSAQYWLGHMYGPRVSGSRRTWPRACPGMTKAADQGLVLAQRDLGQIYMRGDGVLQDYGKAHSRLQAAANQNDAISQRLLGELYANGWSVEKDPIWAYVWYDYAAKNGDKKALSLRAQLVKTMSTEDIEEAEKLAEKVKGEIFGQKS